MELGQLLRCVACQRLLRPSPPPPHPFQKRTWSRALSLFNAPQFRNGPLQFLARSLDKLFVIVQWAGDGVPANSLLDTLH